MQGKQVGGFPWGSVIGGLFLILLVGGVLYGFKFAGGLINSDGTLTDDIKVTRKIKVTKEELQDQIQSEYTSELLAKQTDVESSEKVSCTKVELVKESETDVAIKYTGFAELSDNTSIDVVVTIDKSDGSRIWKTGRGRS
jgi:hypothetical protein